jgi:hypothetical protein
LRAQVLSLQPGSDSANDVEGTIIPTQNWFPVKSDSLIGREIDTFTFGSHLGVQTPSKMAAITMAKLNNATTFVEKI